VTVLHDAASEHGGPALARGEGASHGDPEAQNWRKRSEAIRGRGRGAPQRPGDPRTRAPRDAPGLRVAAPAMLRPGRTGFLFLLLALLAAPPARAESPSGGAERRLLQRVALHVAFVDTAPTRVTATVQQDGAQHALVLTDDGTDPADAAGDRVWSGSLVGAPAQYLPITVTAERGGVTQDVWRGVVRGGLEGSVEIGLEVTAGPDGALVGRRRATTAPGGMAHAAEALPLLAVTAWGVLLLVGAAVAGTRRGGDEARRAATPLPHPAPPPAGAGDDA
jgi:hypothetical protein